METHENRLRRMQMRSMRRGIKEMDIVIGNFATDRLRMMSTAELDAFDALLDENDQDLLVWITGQVPAPDSVADLVARIRDHAQGH